LISGFNKTFAGLKITNDDIIESGDKVVVRSTIEGIQAGDFAGFPSKGRPFKIRLLDVSNGFEEISEWGAEQVDDGDVGCGVSVSSGTSPCGLEDAVQAFEASVGVG